MLEMRRAEHPREQADVSACFQGRSCNSPPTRRAQRHEEVVSKIKLLLVDDEEDYVKAMAERMEMRDVGSRVAFSGEEALRLLEDEAPDVMVLDLRMPGIDGMQVLERVKQEHPHVQVIILTGHGSEKEEEEARRLGAFEYLQKPTDTSDLLKTVRSAWKKSLRFLKESKDEFDRSMTAAALAEGGATKWPERSWQM